MIKCTTFCLEFLFNSQYLPRKSLEKKKTIFQCCLAMLYFFLFPFADAIDNVRFFLSRASFFLFFLSLLLSMCLLLCPRMAPHGLRLCGRSAHNNSSLQAFPSQNSFFFPIFSLLQPVQCLWPTRFFFSYSSRPLCIVSSPFWGVFFFFFFLFSLVYQLDACRAVSFYSLNVFLCP